MAFERVQKPATGSPPQHKSGIQWTRPWSDPLQEQSVQPKEQPTPRAKPITTDERLKHNILFKLIEASSLPHIQPESDEANFSSPHPIQAKLVIGKPGKYEQEADNMAAKVMAMPESAIQRQQNEENSILQTSEAANSITPLVQRLLDINREEVQSKPEVQKAANNSTPTSSNIENRLANSKSGGSPLPKDVKSFMEPRFGAPFSAVRVHTDSTAVQMNKELGAQAFAHGNHIYYGAGKSPGKNELTAHELTHTIQQTGGIQAKRLSPEVLPPYEFKLTSSTKQLQAKQLQTKLSSNPKALPKSKHPPNPRADATETEQKLNQLKEQLQQVLSDATGVMGTIRRNPVGGKCVWCGVFCGEYLS